MIYRSSAASNEAACQGIDKNLSLLGAELQEVNAKYKTNENSAKAVAEKQEILKRTYDEQAKKVAETERAYESMVRQYGETSSEAKELEFIYPLASRLILALCLHAL